MKEREERKWEELKGKRKAERGEKKRKKGGEVKGERESEESVEKEGRWGKERRKGGGRDMFVGKERKRDELEGRRKAVTTMKCCAHVLLATLTSVRSIHQPGLYGNNRVCL